jgi:hypothetical protein
MRISMDMHRPAEAVIGFLLIALPFVADVGAVAMVLSVLLGATLIAIAYSSWQEGAAIPPATHAAIDRIVAGGIGLAALIALVSGQGAGFVILLLLGLAMLGLILTTRYTQGVRSGPPPRPGPAGPG